MRHQQSGAQLRKRPRLHAALAAAVALAAALGSCRAPHDVTYFSGLDSGSRTEIAAARDITVRPDDRVSIVVTSKDPQLASLFNLPVVAQRVGQPGVETSTGRSSNEVASYVVDPCSGDAPHRRNAPRGSS